MNFLGYYRGGVPQYRKGGARGKAAGNPGFLHSPHAHNYYEFPHQDTAQVTSEDALAFKHYMNTDKTEFMRAQPYYPMYYDRNWNFIRERYYWLNLLLLMFGATVLKGRYEIEKERWTQWWRKERFEQEAIPHHYVNRNGVVLEKEFVGFEKYYQNDAALMAWYKKAYPSKFGSEEE